MEGKYVGDLQQVTTLSTDAQLIVVQDNLTQRSTVAEIMKLLTTPEATQEAGVTTIVTETTVTTVVQANLEPYDTRINENALAISQNSTDITSLGTRITSVETKSTNWDVAFGWGNHVAVGYERQSNKNVASGYCPLDQDILVPLANIPALTIDKIPTLTWNDLPAITNDQLPAIDSTKIPDIYSLKSEVYWQNIDLADVTDFDPSKEYRVTYLDDTTSKTVTAYPHKVQNTRLFFVEYYMNSSSKVSVKDYSNNDLSNFSVISVQSRFMGVVE